jgi:thimet oligopeptidase
MHKVLTIFALAANALRVNSGPDFEFRISMQLVDD